MGRLRKKISRQGGTVGLFTKPSKFALDLRIAFHARFRPRERNPMELEDIHERLSEYKRLWPEPGKDDLSLLKAVIFIEDVFELRIMPSGSPLTGRFSTTGSLPLHLPNAGTFSRPKVIPKSLFMPMRNGELHVLSTLTANGHSPCGTKNLTPRPFFRYECLCPFSFLSSTLDQKHDH